MARSIRNDIETGVLRDGNVLPSTRDLAEQWGVSVFTITEAMKLLADEGVVISKPRSKRVVSAPDQTRRSEIRTPKPHVLLIGGYAGSGKTELGRMLARLTGWPFLDIDTLTRPVVEAALQTIGLPPNDRESDGYHTLIRPREYEALFAALLDNVGCGNSAIVTAQFLREFDNVSWIRRTEASLKSLDAKTTFVWVRCDVELMQGNIRRRGAVRDSAKLADWPAYSGSIDVDFRPPVPHQLVNNCTLGEPLQDQASKLLKAILIGN
ncbi:GntR family transcriptional regulator [Actinoplanes sp. NPDC051346]|uniref:GntR family transcriptional regulator n=1 Tax=Actinoplanes sp. NPDC051346 TaxID=3155048 RepID=UPI0034265513